MLVAFDVPSCADSSRPALLEQTERNGTELEVCNESKISKRMFIFV
jgi:hypothetical protein